jgi:hypothetical protein
MFFHFIRKNPTPAVVFHRRFIRRNPAPQMFSSALTGSTADVFHFGP